MLVQRLRVAEPTVEAAIAHNLVDLALAAPESSFIDIIRAFSALNLSANMDDPRFSNNMVRQIKALTLPDVSTQARDIGPRSSNQARSRTSSTT